MRRIARGILTSVERMAAVEGTNDAMIASFTIPAPADFHVHLRQGALMKLVVPHLVESRVKLAFVMVSKAMAHRSYGGRD